MYTQPLESQDYLFRLYGNEIAKTDLLTREQEVELVGRIKKGDHEARSHMIRANLRLAVSIALDYQNYGVPLLDLISEGNIGLMKAVEQYDPSKGSKFSTYAAWGIKQSIKRALSNQSRTIRLPVHTVDLISKMRRVARSMSEELGREPTDDEISRELGIKRTWLAQLKVAAMRPASLDAEMERQGSGDGESDVDMGTRYSLEPTNEDDAAPSTPHVTKEMHKMVYQLLGKLNDQEKDIIIRRFGLYGRRCETLEEIGQGYDLVRERIRQLQRQALRKMHRILNKLEDPELRHVRTIEQTPPGKTGKRTGPIGIEVASEDQDAVFRQIDKHGGALGKITQIRAKILFAKLLQNPRLLVKDFENTLSARELSEFNYKGAIHSLVMPSGGVYKCLQYAIDRVRERKS